MSDRRSISLNIPEDIILSLKIPKDKIHEELLKELAITLYERHILSFGKSRELAKMQQFSVKYQANALTAGLENPAYRDRRDILVPHLRGR